ncbi:MAG: type I restriction enzyme HsdR N-terminal domain-containing protein [Paludibacteraceae bacterium]|nr:type I restriction enzyme HsdR N-terminal domain-containing protein [Paludibacteraceae bacterium]
MFLNFPKYEFNIEKKDNKSYIYDVVRNKFVALTPEELVRQNMVQYLICECHVPKSHIANEVPISLNQMTKRCDTVVYSQDLKPLVIVEYKAPTVSLSQSVFNQILTYNTVLHVPYLLVSNGLRHFFCKVDNDGGVSFFPQIPDFRNLTF